MNVFSRVFFRLLLKVIAIFAVYFNVLKIFILHRLMKTYTLDLRGPTFDFIFFLTELQKLVSGSCTQLEIT